MQKEKLYLEDIFDIDWNQAKIKFNQTEPKENKNPLELWCANPETVNTEWLFWEKDKNRFKVGGHCSVFDRYGKRPLAFDLCQKN